jgi:uncharacterized membrane protein
MKLDNIWGWLWAQTLRGLILLVPVVVTVSFLVWLSRTVDQLLKPIVLLALPPEWYVPGLALVLFLGAALLLGMLTRNVLMRKLGETVEQWVAKTPVIGSIYPIVRQLTDVLSGKDTQQNGKVVLVSLPGVEAQAFGIVMQQGDSAMLDWLPPDCDLVYLPMSYQLGGYSLVLPRSRLQTLNIKTGEALQMIITGGIGQSRVAAEGVSHSTDGQAPTG